MLKRTGECDVGEGLECEHAGDVPHAAKAVNDSPFELGEWDLALCAPLLRSDTANKTMEHTLSLDKCMVELRRRNSAQTQQLRPPQPASPTRAVQKEHAAAVDVESTTHNGAVSDKLLVDVLCLIQV
mmetsp:Transcript_8693/g.18533  ORF Transcript_8693/g.18533 Transcript_8693/m.18533 type:complete len:127 (-) Transcript_8693:62-442(-)